VRPMHPISVCVVSTLGLALISPLLPGQDPSHNSVKAPNSPLRPVVIARSALAPQAGSSPIARVPDSYGKLPISFEANQGQADSRVRFLARAGGYSLYVTSSEALLSLHRSQAGSGRQASNPRSSAAWTRKRKERMVTRLRSACS
jgi:hypothetical protein